MALTAGPTFAEACAVDPPAEPAASRRPIVAIVVLLTVAAAGLRLERLGFGNAHSIVDYDGGVDFGSALELVRGVLPYRDYVFLHPPGIALLFAPVAFLAKLIGTAQAMGIAKVLTGLAGAACVPLTGWLVRSRGLVAVALACAVVAFQPDSVASAYSLLLEPWLVLFCLIGAVLVFRGDELAGDRRLGWGGVLFGIAAAIKIWAFAPILVILLICLPRRRRTLSFGLGSAVGFLVPVLPFLVAAPGSFVHDVFYVQLFRTADVRTPLSQRLIHIFSVAAPNAAPPSPGKSLLLIDAVAVIALLIGAWVRHLRGSTALEKFAVFGSVAAVAMLLVPDTFYWHYAAFSTPFLALALVLPLGWLSRVPRRAWTALFTLAVLGLVFSMAHRDSRSYSHLDDHVAIDAVVPAGSCLVSTTASASIAEDRFWSDRPCPALVDPFGAVLGLSDGASPSTVTVNNPAVVRLWLNAYRQADFVYLKLSVSPTVPTAPVVTRYLHTHFRRVPIQAGGTLYRRVTP